MIEKSTQTKTIQTKPTSRLKQSTLDNIQYFASIYVGEITKKYSLN